MTYSNCSVQLNHDGTMEAPLIILFADAILLAESEGLDRVAGHLHEGLRRNLLKGNVKESKVLVFERDCQV